MHKLTERIYILHARQLSCSRRDSSTGGWHRVRKKSIAVAVRRLMGAKRGSMLWCPMKRHVKAKYYILQAARGKKKKIYSMLCYYVPPGFVASLMGRRRRNLWDTSTVWWLATDRGVVTCTLIPNMRIHTLQGIEGIKRVLLFSSSFRSNLKEKNDDS